MIIDGRVVAKEVEDDLRQRLSVMNLKRKPKVSFLTFGDNRATRSFLKIKEKVANRIGVELQIHELPQDVLEEVAERVLVSISENQEIDGVVVQLPLPEHFDQTGFLALIPKEKDVDCLSSLSMDLFARGEGYFVPPVALAVAEILDRYDVDLTNKKTAVVGHGNLVGRPVANWLRSAGVEFEIFDIGSDLMRLREFDVVVSGVGKPEIIKKEMIKEGVVLIDAGTSEVLGKLSGDISVDAYSKASLVTPVPGGVGPVTVVKLFENLLRTLELR